VILGKRNYFDRHHYEAQAGVAPPHLCELVVHCLELVSQLAHRGLAYRFKGGNSLLVLLEDPQRFSIDVDIVTTTSKEALTQVVASVATDCDVFHRWESRAPKTKPWLPLISFKLFFDSVYQPREDAFVMLDAVLEPAPYPGVQRQVRCGSLYESSAQVEVPSISGLIGDKLLAIGPGTLGIPLGKGKEAQRLKHVFDVATLSRHALDQDAVRQSVLACKEQEETIQGNRYSWDEIVADTRRFCSAPLADEAPPALESLEPGGYYFEVVKGFDAFRRHLFRVDYTWELFRTDCQRVLDVLDTIGRP
jgi:hypothetical protein